VDEEEMNNQSYLIEQEEQSHDGRGLVWAAAIVGCLFANAAVIAGVLHLWRTYLVEPRLRTIVIICICGIVAVLTQAVSLRTQMRSVSQSREKSQKSKSCEKKGWVEGF
jgi:hypothetical protein